jgi:hypothetical protein
VEPKKPRLIVNDTTYQALGEILAANPKGVLVHGDELSGLLHSLDTAGQEAARGFYLSAWGGSGSYTFDRIGRGSIRLKHYAVSVFGGFQPDKIKHYVQMAQSGSSQNDGLLQRFQLLVWPDLDEKYQFVDRSPDQAALGAMNSAMLNLRSAGKSGQLITHGSYLLHFDAQAQAGFTNGMLSTRSGCAARILAPLSRAISRSTGAWPPVWRYSFTCLKGTMVTSVSTVWLERCGSLATLSRTRRGFMEQSMARTEQARMRS